MNNKISQRLNNSDKFPWIIICIGISLRLIRYLYNPPLYFDESNIAIDLISRSFSDLFYPSPNIIQGYPFIFLATIKLLTQILGNSEYVLRLFPLLSGIISLFLFYKVAKHYIDSNAVLIALGFFAVSDFLIFESSDLKPYASDVLFTLLIYILIIYIQSRELNIQRIILFAVSGAFVIWFANPSVFVLAGVGICLAVSSLSKKEWSKIGKLSIVYLIWVLSFMANYFFYIRELQASFNMSMEEMLSVFENAYMPMPPKSLADIKWFLELFFEIFNYPVAMTLTGISVLAFIIGCISMYSGKKRNFFLLISPILVTFLAAALHQYIFKGRFIMFLVPLILLIIAEGAEYIRNKTMQNSKIIGIVFLSLLFLHPVLISAYRVKKPLYLEEDVKLVLKYVKENWQEGDILYLHYYTRCAFDYYTKYHPEPYKFDEGEYVVGIAPRGWYRHHDKMEVSKYYDPGVPVKQSSIEIFKIYARDLDRLKGNKRVWILFTGSIPKDGITEEKFFVYHLETIGKRLNFFGRPGISSVYLYDLSSEN